LVKKPFESQPEGRRNIGRSIFKLMKDAEIDFAEIKVNKRMQKTNIREEWTCVLGMPWFLQHRRVQD
jgi:hypothetical protein